MNFAQPCTWSDSLREAGPLARGPEVFHVTTPQHKGESKRFTEKAEALVTSVRADASSTGRLKEAYERNIDGGMLPSDYLWVTDLVNPIAGYHARKHLGDDSPERLETVALGSGVHRRARHWFRALPGFALNEGGLEGTSLGLEGVLGNVDFLLGQAILEFRAKEGAPKGPEDAVSRYPQDLERLLFSARLFPGAGERHFLAFFGRRNARFTAFRVDLLDRSVVLKVLRQRVEELRRALKTGDPSQLGRCRAFGAGCRFREAGVCSCEALEPIDISALLGAVRIARDEDLEWAMSKAREQAALPPEGIAWWDLLSPRRRYLRRDGGGPSCTQDIQRKVGREVLGRCIRNARGLRPGSAAEREAWDSAWGRDVSCSPNVVLARSAERPGRVETRPYVVQAPKGPVRDAKDLVPSSIAELAVRCAKLGLPRGAVFSIHPDEENEIAAYTVSFRSVRELRALVEEQVEAIQAADRTEDPSLLPKCEPFLRDACTEACLCRS